jgi:hypothetical protein
MKTIVISAIFLFSSIFAFCQSGLKCDIGEIDTLMTPVEKCILNCIKQLPLENYLAHRDIGFFD